MPDGNTSVRWLRDVARRLVRDRPSVLTLAAALALMIPAAVGLDAALRLRLLLLATPAILAWLLYWARRQHAASTAEAQRFWGDLSLALGMWLTAASLHLVLGIDSVTARVMLDTAYAVYYVALVRASDRQLLGPAQTPGGRWPMAAIFVAGLFLYWVILTALVQPGLYVTQAPSRLLYLTIDGYLTVRFAVLAVHAVRAMWRITFAALASTTFLTLTYGMLRLTDISTRLTDPFWYLPFVTLMLALRVETQPAGGSADGLDRPHHAPIFAVLLLPAVHLAGYGAGLLEPTLRGPRELLAGAWVVVFGALAVVERRRLLRAIRRATRERRNLRQKPDSKGDLRVILERRRTDHTVSQVAEKYTRAFDICPDAIGISTADDGRFLEVNPAFETLTGHDREAILGKRSSDLRIWFQPDDRRQLIARVRDHGHAAGVTLPIRVHGDQRRLARFWAQPLDIDGLPCVIIVARAVDEPGGLDAMPEPLDSIAEPAVIANADGRVLAANAHAVLRFGAEPLRDRGTTAVFEPLEEPSWDLVRQHLQPTGAHVCGDLRALALDGEGTMLLLVGDAQARAS